MGKAELSILIDHCYRLNGQKDTVTLTDKLKQIGFKPSKTIEDAINEIKEAIEDGKISNYDDAKYSNYKLLFGSKEMQEKVFIQGIPGSLDVP